MAAKYRCNLDEPLLKLSSHDLFTVRDALAGVNVFGATGGGKTSGSGKHLAHALLKGAGGFGGLVLVAKPDEVALWERYAMDTGRIRSLIVFDETQGFNFLTYALAKQGVEGIGSVVETLLTIVEATRRQEPGGNGGDAFWKDSMRQLLRYCLPILYAADGTVSITSILDFIYAVPTSAAQYDPDNATALHGNVAVEAMQRARERPKGPVDRATIDEMIRYWVNQYTAIPDKTRGNILISLSSALDRFKHGRLRRAFCEKTTIVPDMCFHGAIIVMAMPALTWGSDGIVAQQLFKYMWQKTIEGRNANDLAPEFRERPVFLFSDEAHYFVNSYDNEFLSTCRSARAAVVFMSQNLTGYMAKMGKAEEAAAEALIGKFNTHIFHANACPKTNKFASDMIGRAVQRRSNYSHGTGFNRNQGMNTGAGTSWGSSSGSSYGDGGRSSNSGFNKGGNDSLGSNRGMGSNENTSHGFSEAMDNIVEPNFFTTGLKTGGPAHSGQVSALLFNNSGGFKANNRQSFMTVTFQQGRK